MGNCLTALLGLSVVLTALFLLFLEPILWAFGASSNTIGYAMEYMGVYVWGTVFVQISLGMNMFITSQGFAKTSMFTVVIGAALTSPWTRCSSSSSTWASGERPSPRCSARRCPLSG